MVKQKKNRRTNQDTQQLLLNIAKLDIILLGTDTECKQREKESETVCRPAREGGVDMLNHLLCKMPCKVIQVCFPN